MWGQVAKLGLDLYASGLKAKAQYESDIANSKIQQLSRRVAGNRETQAYLKNVSNLAQQSTEANLNISRMAMQAQDAFETGMAGSGITGTSVSEIKADITRSVAEDRLAVERSTVNQRDAMHEQLRQSNENRVIEANQARMPNYHTGITNALLNSASSALAIGGAGIDYLKGLNTSAPTTPAPVAMNYTSGGISSRMV